MDDDPPWYELKDCDVTAATTTSSATARTIKEKEKPVTFSPSATMSVENSAPFAMEQLCWMKAPEMDDENLVIEMCDLRAVFQVGSSVTWAFHFCLGCLVAKSLQIYQRSSAFMAHIS